MFKEMIAIVILLMLSGQNALAEGNQQLADIVATDPKAEIQAITSNMIAVLPDLPTSASQTLWNAGVDNETWDEDQVALLVAQVGDAEQTLKKVATYKQQYAYVFKHRNDDVINAKQWLMRVGGAMFHMKKQAKRFEQRIRYLKKTLPKVIKSTARLYENTNNDKKPILKLRLQAQLLCYQEMNFPVDEDIQVIQNEYSL